MERNAALDELRLAEESSRRAENALEVLRLELDALERAGVAVPLGAVLDAADLETRDAAAERRRERARLLARRVDSASRDAAAAKEAVERAQDVVARAMKALEAASR